MSPRSKMGITDHSWIPVKTSKLRWHERFAEVLRDMGFVSYTAEPDIWMKDCEDHYEYIAVYCDDLTVTSKDPKAIMDAVIDMYDYKLKGTGPLKLLLCCDYFLDSNNTLCFAPKKYIERMVGTYERLFGEKPRQNYLSPLEKNNHPELDTSELLPLAQTKNFQSLISDRRLPMGNSTWMF